jgi:hypothetical protein
MPISALRLLQRAHQAHHSPTKIQDEFPAVDGEFRQLQGSLEQHYDGVAQVSLVKQRLAAPVTSGHRNRLERGASVRA